MFSDRRGVNDRRKQNLPIPSALDRRSSGRRNKSFASDHWWLRVDYADELVVEAKAEFKKHLQAKSQSSSEKGD
jgi:hypothetical protein